MNIKGLETKYQNYAASGTSCTDKNSSSESTFASFRKELVNWEKRIKEANDKEKENDSKGSIQMSEKQWDKLMKKIDTAIGTSEDNMKEREKEKEKQSAEKNLNRKDSVAN